MSQHDLMGQSLGARKDGAYLRAPLKIVLYYKTVVLGEICKICEVKFKQLFHVGLYFVVVLFGAFA